MEKEVAEVQEMKVNVIILIFFIFNLQLVKIHCLFVEVYHVFVSYSCFIQKKISTMTADEYFEKHPELKKKFDDEIRNDYWGY